MKSLIVVTILTLASVVQAGTPAFCVGQRTTHLSIDGTRTALRIHNEASSSSDEDLEMSRLLLSVRYGLLPSVDLVGKGGMASLDFGNLPAGFAAFKSDLALAWGAEVRCGVPVYPESFQVTAAVNYFGTRPSGETSAGAKTVHSQFTWHEVTPTVTAVYALGVIRPYIGLSKPFLFGEKKTDVTLYGVNLSALGGSQTYRDGEQPLRLITGLAWRLPSGYSVGGEAAMATDGYWTLSLGISQMLR